MRLSRIYTQREYTLDGLVRLTRIYVLLSIRLMAVYAFVISILFECLVALGLLLLKFEFRPLLKQARVSNEPVQLFLYLFYDDQES